MLEPLKNSIAAGVVGGGGGGGGSSGGGGGGGGGSDDDNDDEEEEHLNVFLQWNDKSMMLKTTSGDTENHSYL